MIITPLFTSGFVLAQLLGPNITAGPSPGTCDANCLKANICDHWTRTPHDDTHPVGKVQEEVLLNWLREELRAAGYSPNKVAKLPMRDYVSAWCVKYPQQSMVRAALNYMLHAVGRPELGPE
jgi:hypothetical protein